MWGCVAHGALLLYMDTLHDMLCSVVGKLALSDLSSPVPSHIPHLPGIALPWGNRGSHLCLASQYSGGNDLTKACQIGEAALEQGRQPLTLSAALLKAFSLQSWKVILGWPHPGRDQCRLCLLELPKCHVVGRTLESDRLGTALLTLCRLILPLLACVSLSIE